MNDERRDKARLERKAAYNLKKFKELPYLDSLEVCPYCDKENHQGYIRSRPLPCQFWYYCSDCPGKWLLTVIKISGNDFRAMIVMKGLKTQQEIRDSFRALVELKGLTEARREMFGNGAL